MTRSAALAWLAGLALACAGPRAPASAPSAPVAYVHPLDVPPLPETEPPLSGPPPVAGGTLLITRDGAHAVASDPDRDLVWVASLASPPSLVGRFALRAGDEPGRLAEDAHGRVHVALRGGGAIVSLDLAGRRVTRRREVCGAPRGLAVDGDLLHVACAGGELATLPAAGDGPMTVQHLLGDLRDVGVDADGLWVSRFRAAELLRIGVDGPVRHKPTPVVRADPAGRPASFVARVAWRAIADGRGGVWVLHQRHNESELYDNGFGTVPYYGREGAVLSAITRWSDDREAAGLVLPGHSLPVDVAALPTGELAVVFAGDRDLRLIRPDTAGSRPLGVITPLDGGQPIAVAHHPRVGVVVQLRAPASLAVIRAPGAVDGLEERVALGARFSDDPGHARFHAPTRLGIACASCHPEGGDDGHVYHFPRDGLRRTQPLTGGVLRGAPYHWRGELTTFEALLAQTLETRMGGEPASPAQVAQLAGWLDAIADLPGPSPRDEAASRRGAALFEDPEVGCATCHPGPRGTDGQAHDVGTGGRFVTPPLAGIAARAPYLHDGCAQTLEDRFTICHTEGHGRLDHLEPAQRADLVAYVRGR